MLDWVASSPWGAHPKCSPGGPWSAWYTHGRPACVPAVAADHDMAAFYNCWVSFDKSYTWMHGLSLPPPNCSRSLLRNMEIVQAEYGNPWNWSCMIYLYKHTKHMLTSCRLKKYSRWLAPWLMLWHASQQLGSVLRASSLARRTISSIFLPLFTIFPGDVEGFFHCYLPK